MKGGRVRFVEGPGADQICDSNQELLDALQIDDTSSISEVKMEASFMSEGNINRYNYIGRTPHAKVIEAVESKKRFKELTKLMTMAPISQTPVRISVPISEISPQSDISMSPLPNNENCSTVSTPQNIGFASCETSAQKSTASLLVQGIAFDESPEFEKSPSSVCNSHLTRSNVTSDGSFNIVESLAQEQTNVSSTPQAVMNTPSTIQGSLEKENLDARIPFSDISNRSVPSQMFEKLNCSKKVEDVKSVSFHHSQLNSVAKSTKSKVPVTPFVKIECSESEDGESDADCSPSIASYSPKNSDNKSLSIVEKKLFLNSSEKTKGVSSDSKPCMHSIDTVGIADLPVQRKSKNERADWHGGLDLAKEMVSTEDIQIQYIIVPAPRPSMNDAGTTYSPYVENVRSQSFQETVPMSTSCQPQTASIATSPMVFAESSPASIAVVEKNNVKVIDASTAIQQVRTVISSTGPVDFAASNKLIKAQSTSMEAGVSFGRGPNAVATSKITEISKTSGSCSIMSKDPEPIMKQSVVEKPIVPVCIADLHPAKAFYSPNNTRKVQQMLIDSNQQHHVNHAQNISLHERSHILVAADHPSMVAVSGNEIPRVSRHSVADIQPSLMAKDLRKEYLHMKQPMDGKVETIIAASRETPSKSLLTASTLSDYQQVLSSFRSSDAGVQVDDKINKLPISDMEICRSNRDSLTNTPSSVQTDPLSQSVLLKSATKSTSGGANESVVSSSCSYYYAASSERDATIDDEDASFTLADLLPRTAAVNGLGKGLFPASDEGHVRSTQSNPWIYRLGFDSRQCNIFPSDSRKMLPSSIKDDMCKSVGAGSLGKPRRLLDCEADKKQQLIDQWNESYYQEEDWDESKLKDVAFKEQIEQRFSAATSYGSRGSSSTVTLNRAHRALDVSMRSDIAIATYTNQSMLPSDDSFMTSGADTTFTLDQSYMTKNTLLSQEEVIPRFTIKSLKRSTDDAFEVKEVNFETAPGEHTTVMMVFDNNRPHEVTLSAQTALVRVEPMPSMRRDQGVWDDLADQLAKQTCEDYFTVSPSDLTIPANKEASLFVTFSPAHFVEGIYSGALRIKHDRKSYTLLLRGESAMHHSVQNSPAVLSTSHFQAHQSIPEHVMVNDAAVEVSQLPNYSWNKDSRVEVQCPVDLSTGVAKAPVACNNSSAALELSSVVAPIVQQSLQLPNRSSGIFSHSMAEESAVFSLKKSMENSQVLFSKTFPSPAPTVSPMSNAFQERLRALQDRIAEISRKVLWKTSPASPNGPSTSTQHSPTASEVTSVGLRVEPEALHIDGTLDDYQTLSIMNQHQNQVVIVKIVSSHEYLRASTSMLSINPDSEARILLKINRAQMMNALCEDWFQNVGDRLSCGSLTLQYDTDLEFTVPVFLCGSELQKLTEEYRHQFNPFTKATVLSSYNVMSHDGSRQQLQQGFNLSDYHHQLQSFDFDSVTEVSIAKSCKSQRTPHSLKSGYLKPPLQPSHFLPASVPASIQKQQIQQGMNTFNGQHLDETKAKCYKGSDGVSVASTISSHTHQLMTMEKVPASSTMSHASTDSISVANSVALGNSFQIHSSAHYLGSSSAPDMSLVSNSSSHVVVGNSRLQESSHSVPLTSKDQRTAIIASSSKKMHKKREKAHLLVGTRRGLYFENTTAMFGSVIIGSMVRTRIILANASNQEVVVYLGDVNLPFVLQKNEIKLKPRSFARVPVQFVPVKHGHFQCELIAQSANGEEITSIKLTGHAYV